jgi:hypothetical protein
MKNKLHKLYLDKIVLIINYCVIYLNIKVLNIKVKFIVVNNQVIYSL